MATERRVHSLIVDLTETECLAYQYMCREGDRVPPLATFQKPVRIGELKSLAGGAARALASRMGNEVQLAEWGGRLYDKVIPHELAERLRADPGDSYLVLYLDPAVVWLPWELLWDGRDFIARRFRVARLLQKTGSELRIAEQRLREPRSGRGSLVVFGDISGLCADTEKAEVEAALAAAYGPNNIWFFCARGATDILQQLKQDYEICHFVGHGRYVEAAPEESGWAFADGTVLTCREIEEVSSRAAFPLLIFANSCDSAHSSFEEQEGYVSALYRAFLRQGVPHYIGTISPVPDQPSKAFAGVFWRLLVQGMSVGEALGEARRVFAERAGAPIWACYVHYGDPSYRIVHPTRSRAASYASTKPPGWDETLKERTSFSVLGQSSQEELYRMLNHYKTAIAKNPEDEEAYFALGLCYLQLGLHDLTVKNFQRTIELMPAHADAYYYLALALIRGRRPKTLSLAEVRLMEQHLQTAMQLDGRQAKYYYLAAILKVDYYLANGLSAPPPLPEEFFELGEQMQHDPWEAERLLRSVLLRDPGLISRIRRNH